MTTPFPNLLKLFREKLGVDAANELQKAIEIDTAALHDQVATKSIVDSNVEVKLDKLSADLEVLKTTMSTLLTSVESQKSVAPVALLENKPDEAQIKFVTDTTASLAGLQNLMSTLLERLAQPAVQQKSDVLPSIRSGVATPDMIQLMSGAFKAAGDAQNQMFPGSTIKWNE